MKTYYAFLVDKVAGKGDLRKNARMPVKRVTTRPGHFQN